MTTVWEFPNGSACAADTAADAAEELRERYDGEGMTFDARKAKGTPMKDFEDFMAEFGLQRIRRGKESGSTEWLETFGWDLRRVLVVANNKDLNKQRTLWTVVEGDDGLLYLSAGYHLVNRLQYVFSKKPWKTGQEVFLC